MSPAELEPTISAAAYLRLKATCGVTATGVLVRCISWPLALTNTCMSVELSCMALCGGRACKEALRKVEATKLLCPLLPGRSDKGCWCDRREDVEDCHNLADKHFANRVAKDEDKQLTISHVTISRVR